MNQDPSGVDFDALARTLAALGYPLRLELIRQLRVPHTLRDLKVPPIRGSKSGSRTAAAARQTVSGHLERLVEAGLVRASPGQGPSPSRYAVDPQKLYRFTEDVRRLATIYASRGPAGDATETAPRESPVGPGIPAGPHLVVVHGLLEGKRFLLATGAGASARWRIGRGAGMEVSLHYDPFASTEHAAVVKEGARFFLEDAGSKNGTFVDWERLPARTRVPLSPGGIIGVGRSLLCFRPA